MNNNVVITVLLVLIIPSALFFALEDVDLSSESLNPQVLIDQTKRVFTNFLGIEEPENEDVKDALDFLSEIEEINEQAPEIIEVAPVEKKKATYEVTVVMDWSAQTHPGYFPSSNAHISPFVVWSHTPETTIFTEGSVATPGMEKMAELGGTITLEEELQERVEKGILNFIVADRLDVPGEITESITVDEDHSLITFVTMLAPSPDWFVAVSDVELLVEGDFIESIEVPFVAYDAGTEEGVGFSIKNEETNPVENISPLTDIPAAELPLFGHVIFRLAQ